MMLMASAGSAMGSAWEALPDGFSVETPAGTVRIKAVTDKIIRVSAVPDGVFAEDASLVVVPQGQVPEFKVAQKGEDVSLTTSQVSATVDTKTGAVTFFDNTGKKILAENPGGRTFTPISVEGTDGYTVSQTFASLNDNEGIYGLGQHQANEFNYKGKNEELFQYNTKVSVPFVVSTDNYGLLWDSYSLCRWGNPEDYSHLGEVFTLYDANGNEGALTGNYVPKKGETLVRQEPDIYFEHLIRGDLAHVVNLPKDFK